MLLDALREIVQLEELGLTEGRPLSVGRRHFHFADATGAFEERLLVLATENPIAQLTGVLVDAIGIWRHAAIDDLGSEPVRRVDHDLARVACEWVGGEQDSGDFRGHHCLNDDSDRDRKLFVEGTQVRKNAGAKEARPTRLDRVEHLVLTQQIEGRDVHPGGGGALLIFVGRRRTDGEARRALVAHGEERVADAANDVLREGRFANTIGDRLESRVRHVGLTE